MVHVFFDPSDQRFVKCKQQYLKLSSGLLVVSILLPSDKAKIFGQLKMQRGEILVWFKRILDMKPKKRLPLLFWNGKATYCYVSLNYTIPINLQRNKVFFYLTSKTAYPPNTPHKMKSQPPDTSQTQRYMPSYLLEFFLAKIQNSCFLTLRQKLPSTAEIVR